MLFYCCYVIPSVFIEHVLCVQYCDCNDAGLGTYGKLKVITIWNSMQVVCAQHCECIKCH